MLRQQLHRIVDTALVPMEPREATLSMRRAFHESQGHPTVGAIERAMKQRVWHPEYRLLCQEVVITCAECATRVPIVKLRQQFTPVPRKDPFVCWAIDFAGPFTHTGQKYNICCLIEYVSGFLLTSFTPSACSAFARSIVWILHSVFSAVRELGSDNGAAFIDADIDVFCRDMGIRQLTTPPEYPQRNGRVERTNGQLKQHLHPLQFPQERFIVLVERAMNIYNNPPPSCMVTPHLSSRLVVNSGSLRREEYVALEIIYFHPQDTKTIMIDLTTPLSNVWQPASRLIYSRSAKQRPLSRIYVTILALIAFLKKLSSTIFLLVTGYFACAFVHTKMNRNTTVRGV